MLGPKTVNMFYFNGNKHTTPNCHLYYCLSYTTRQVMNMLDPKTVNMFWFTCNKQTSTPHPTVSYTNFCLTQHGRWWACWIPRRSKCSTLPVTSTPHPTVPWRCAPISTRPAGPRATNVAHPLVVALPNTTFPSFSTDLVPNTRNGASMHTRQGLGTTRR